MGESEATGVEVTCPGLKLGSSKIKIPPQGSSLPSLCFSPARDVTGQSGAHRLVNLAGLLSRHSRRLVPGTGNSDTSLPLLRAGVQWCGRHALLYSARALHLPLRFLFCHLQGHQVSVCPPYPPLPHMVVKKYTRNAARSCLSLWAPPKSCRILQCLGIRSVHVTPNPGLSSPPGVVRGKSLKPSWKQSCVSCAFRSQGGSSDPLLTSVLQHPS